MSVSTALKVAGQVAGESNSSRNISNNLDFSNSLQKYKQISTPIIIIFMIFSPFKRTGKPKINLKSFQWGWTGLAKKCGSIQFTSIGSWQTSWGHHQFQTGTNLRQIRGTIWSSMDLPEERKKHLNNWEQRFEPKNINVTNSEATRCCNVPSSWSFVPF